MRASRLAGLLAAFVRLHPEPLFLWAVFHGLLLAQRILPGPSASTLPPFAFLAGQLVIAYFFTQGAARSCSFDFFRRVAGGAGLWRALAASYLLLLHGISLLFAFFWNGGSTEAFGLFVRPMAEGLFLVFCAAAVVPLPPWLILPLMVGSLAGFSLFTLFH